MPEGKTFDLESRAETFDSSIEALRQSVKKVNDRLSREGYSTIQAARVYTEFIRRWERQNHRQLSIIEHIHILDFSWLHDVFAPMRDELKPFVDYYEKNLPYFLGRSKEYTPFKDSPE